MCVCVCVSRTHRTGGTRTYKSVNIFTIAICCHRCRNHFFGILFHTIIHKIRSLVRIWVYARVVRFSIVTPCRTLQMEDKFIQAFCKLVFVLGLCEFCVRLVRPFQMMSEIALWRHILSNTSALSSSVVNAAYINDIVCTCVLPFQVLFSVTFSAQAHHRTENVAKIKFRRLPEMRNDKNSLTRWQRALAKHNERIHTHAHRETKTPHTHTNRNFRVYIRSS